LISKASGKADLSQVLLPDPRGPIRKKLWFGGLKILGIIIGFKSIGGPAAGEFLSKHLAVKFHGKTTIRLSPFLSGVNSESNFR
jgi:hypothetical protein